LPAAWLIFLIPLAYQVLSIAACLGQVLRKPRPTGFAPPISILKPVRGLDPEMFDTLATQARQNYPEFEILFGVSDAADPAISVIERLRAEFPDLSIALHVGAAPAENAKVGTLCNLADFARYPIWLVNDSDIGVTPEYLSQVVAPLESNEIGLVTCLYRAKAHYAPALWESFGIAVDFMPSTLVAPIVGVREFGLGSTLCFRRDEFQAAGGFEALKDYIADDYQLARRIVQTGKDAYLSEYVVDTELGDSTWTRAFEHQLRWARTIKASKGAGFAGLPVTHAGIWALVALCVQAWPAALALVAIRVIAALASGWMVIGLERNVLWSLLAPVWDLYAFAVWAISYLSNEVRWRDRRLRIMRDGRLEQIR
jgi:ceramide glucosyltransferase